MQAKAYAKINLCLDVVNKRADGYHDLKTVMQTVDLYDSLTFQIKESKEKKIKLTSNHPGLPLDCRNLVCRAAELFMKLTGICLDIEVHIQKRIPVAAGLGGGSSDAGCTLRVLNRWAGEPLDWAYLSVESKAIGADVPFAVYGGTALVEGIGEQVFPIPKKENIGLVLVCPRISVSTKSVFQRYVLDDPMEEKVLGVAEALKKGDIRLLGQNLFNKLERVTIKDYPLIGEIKNMLMNAGAFGAVMSGSGPSVFGVFPDLDEALKAEQNIAYRLGRSVRTFCIMTVEGVIYEQ